MKRWWPLDDRVDWLTVSLESSLDGHSCETPVTIRWPRWLIDSVSRESSLDGHSCETLMTIRWPRRLIDSVRWYYYLSPPVNYTAHIHTYHSFVINIQLLSSVVFTKTCFIVFITIIIIIKNMPINPFSSTWKLACWSIKNTGKPM